MLKDQDHFEQYFNNFVASSDAKEHRQAIENLLAKKHLKKEFQFQMKLGAKEVINLFQNFDQATGFGDNPTQEHQSILEAGNLFKKYIKDREFHKLADLAFTLVFRNVADFLELSKRKDYEKLTYHDLYHQKLLPPEIFFQFFILETLANSEVYNWKREQKIIDQSLVCLMVCFISIYDFLHQAEEDDPSLSPPLQTDLEPHLNISQQITSSLEIEIENLLNDLGLRKKITVSDIKDIICNETSSSDLMRLVQALSEYAHTQDQVSKILQLVQQAWNHWPHESLGFLSPEEKAQGKKLPRGVWVPKNRKTLQEVFANQYPQSVRFIKMGEDTWGFEFPAIYHDLIEKLWGLEETDISADEYEAELIKLLNLMPELFDAANDLANFYIYNDENKSAQKIYGNTVVLAKSYISKTFQPGKDRIIWAYLDNRPFLRLLAGYAMFLETNKGASHAIPYYEELIAFNPNDNQGIRAFLCTAYFKTNQLEQILALIKRYPHDITPEIAMGGVLALYKLDKIEEAKKRLEKIAKYQQHIIKELLKSSHSKPVDLMEDRVTVGGDDEAYYYFQSQGDFWIVTKGAKEFLLKYTEKFLN